MSSVLGIRLDGDNCWPDLANRESDIVHVKGRMEIARLAGGMASGKSPVAVRVDLPDGKVAIAECSMSQF